MMHREERSSGTKILLMIIGILLFLMLLIVGTKKYSDYSIEKNMVKDENINSKGKIVNYSQIKKEVEIIGVELEKIIKIDKKLKKEEINQIKLLLVSDRRLCDDFVSQDEIFECYIGLKDKLKPFKSLIKDENISKLFDNKKEKIHTELPKKEIVTTKQIKKTKDEAYQFIIDTYKSLFKDYTEQLDYCKKEEKKYEKERTQKQFDKRVIVQQNRTLLTCYETLELTEEGLESTAKNLDGNYSQKISKEIGDMAKVFSQNKKMIESKLVEFRTKVNEK